MSYFKVNGKVMVQYVNNFVVQSTLVEKIEMHKWIEKNHNFKSIICVALCLIFHQ